MDLAKKSIQLLFQHRQTTSCCIEIWSQKRVTLLNWLNFWIFNANLFLLCVHFWNWVEHFLVLIFYCDEKSISLAWFALHQVGLLSSQEMDLSASIHLPKRLSKVKAVQVGSGLNFKISTFCYKFWVQIR